MPLAGDQHTIAGPSFCQGTADGLGSIDHHFNVELGAEAVPHVVDYCLGIFASRVVGGQQRQIGGVLDRSGHQRALTPVAVATGAENADQPAVDDLAQRSQRAAECVRRMGVVDEHSERLPAFQPLEPAGHVLDGLQPADDRGQVDPVGQPHRGGDQAVVYVVRADHLRPHRHHLAAGHQQESLLADVPFNHVGHDLGGRADTHGQHRPVKLVQVAGRGWVVGVEHGEALAGQVSQQLRFGQSVVVDRAVVVEVIAADVGHAHGVESNAGHSRLVQAVAGDLHNRVRAAVVDHSGQPLRQFIRRGSGQGGRFGVDSVEISQGSQHAHVVSGSGQHAGDQAGGGCLAVGPRDADDFQLPTGIVGQRLAHPAVGHLGVGHYANRHPGAGHGAFGQDRRAAPLLGLNGKTVPVVGRAGQGGKQIAVMHSPGIARARSDADVVGVEEFRFRQQAT